MKKISLYFQSGTSDKEYHVQLEKSGAGYIVNFQYGRRGSALKSGTKTPAALPLEQAEKVYEKLVKSKKAKGYSAGAESVVQAFSSPEFEDRATGINPQLLVEVKTKEELDKMINDPTMVAQEKKNGQRRLLDKKDTETIGINKKGLAVPVPTKLSDSVKDMCTLDGEIIGTTLYVFDIISFKGRTLKNKPYLERLSILDSLTFGKNIKVVPTAVDTGAKKKLLEKLMKENKEGIVFKKMKHKYKEGRPASGGDVFKYKFYKTTTCRVASHTEGKRSVGLEMLDKGVVKVGKVTIPPNKKIPDLSTFIEVKYLYAHRGGSLYQPIYLGERTDQDETDIYLNQLVYKADEEEV